MDHATDKLILAMLEQIAFEAFDAGEFLLIEQRGRRDDGFAIDGVNSCTRDDCGDQPSVRSASSSRFRDRPNQFREPRAAVVVAGR